MAFQRDLSSLACCKTCSALMRALLFAIQRCRPLCSPVCERLISPKSLSCQSCWLKTVVESAHTVLLLTRIQWRVMAKTMKAMKAKKLPDISNLGAWCWIAMQQKRQKKKAAKAMKAMNAKKK